MAAGSNYPAEVRDPSGKVIWGGNLLFTDSSNQPGNQASPTFTGTVTLPATVLAGSLPASDPHVVGQLWANSHVVTVSAG